MSKALAKTEPVARSRRKPREHRLQPSLLQSSVAWPQDVLWPAIDRYCGRNGERIIHAYAVIALGNARSRYAFFGEHVKVVGRDRLTALEQLAGRRWGRIEGVEGGDTQQLPIQIVNVFTEAPKDGTVVVSGNGH
jgi:hypothetical protein